MLRDALGGGAGGGVQIATTIVFEEGGGVSTDSQTSAQGGSGEQGRGEDVADSFNSALEAWAQDQKRVGGVLEGLA